MKTFFSICFLLLVCTLLYAFAPRHKHTVNELPQSEVELMTRVMECLNHKDSFSYYNLFPSFDTLWHLVMHNSDHSPEAEKELNELKEHPQRFLNYDPFYNPNILYRFSQVLGKGEDSGIRWDGIVLQRFELHKQELTRDDIGLEKVIPERFSGYIFVRDMLSSTTWCITIIEIQKIKGYYFGGQLMNIMQAANVEEYQKRVRQEEDYYEKKRLAAEKARRDAFVHDSLEAIGKLPDQDSALTNNDSVAQKLAQRKKDSVYVSKRELNDKNKKDPLVANPSPDEDTSNSKKEVVNRKYYTGKFDEEIPVSLYVRYMKDSKKGMVFYWDALYKFGDQVDYVKLNVSKSAEGKWLFEEPNASMEMDLNEKQYTGDWINNENQTGYDVLLNEATLSQPMMDKFDQILDKGTWGKSNDDNADAPPPKDPRDDEDRGNDN